MEHLHKHHREEDFSNIFQIVHEGYKEKLLNAEQALLDLSQCVETLRDDPLIMNSAVENLGGYENVTGENHLTMSSN